MTSTFLAFLGVSLIVIVTPGPDTALTIRNTLFGGRGAGIATAAGVIAGQAVWALATSLGGVALLVASEPLFLTIKYAGAAYLIVLGVQALRAALRPPRERPTAIGAPGARKLTLGAAFRQGLLSNLGNPKMAVFFASLLPQFVPLGAATFGAFLTLGLVFCCLTLVWLAAYAVVVAKAGEVLLRPKVRRAIEAATGAVLIALGLRIAAEQR
ncbi:MAG: LysE family translocator [Hyphomicrobiales bacterium]